MAKANPSELNQAVEAIRQSIRQYRALSEVADAVEKLAASMNAAAEVEARLAAIKDEETLAKASLADIKAKGAETKAKMEDEIKERTLAAVDEINAAKAEAKQVRAKARETAEEIIAKAQAQAHDIITAAQATTVEAANRKADLVNDLMQLQQAKTATEQELASLQGQVATIKASLAAVLG